jgi:hypothetical protein
MKYLLLLLVPFVLVALVAVSPLALLYFLFDRLCDLIEEFRPNHGRRPGKKQPNRAEQLGQLLSAISKKREVSSTKRGRSQSAAEPAL